jgi:hypothetical protein
MNEKKILLTSVYISLFIQIFTGGLDIYALTLTYQSETLIIKSLLWLETMVQLIEGTFYLWLVKQFRNLDIESIASKRYFDWAVTTPTMLFTLCIYLDYLRNIQNKKQSENYASIEHDESDIPTKKTNSFELLYESFQNNRSNIIPILILNALMLLFGYLGEVKLMNDYLAVFLGFLPFFAMFYIIYENYAKFTKNGETIFWYFAIVWSLYGVAAIMPYLWKNISYNILDIFAKNFFGIFLAFVAIKHT